MWGIWRGGSHGSGPANKQGLPAACILNGRKEPQPLPYGNSVCVCMCAGVFRKDWLRFTQSAVYILDRTLELAKIRRRSWWIQISDFRQLYNPHRPHTRRKHSHLLKRKWGSQHVYETCAVSEKWELILSPGNCCLLRRPWTSCFARVETKTH